MIGAIAKATLGTLIDRLVPDRNAAERAKEEIEKLDQQGELSLLMGQLGINQQEAQHRSLFVAGWRPAIGWVCGIALANNYLIVPYAAAAGLPVVPVNLNEIMPVLLGMLGLGAMRSYEKVKGAAR